MQRKLVRMAIMVLGITGLAACGGVSSAEVYRAEGGLDSHASINWIDLGLPSGLLWAECNLVATSPEEYGHYYAWAETSPQTVYRWASYRYATVGRNGEPSALSKYNTISSYGATDDLYVLQSADDAATQTLGAGAHIPTQEEWQELLDNTTTEWVTLNGVGGRQFTAPNGNSLFLPAAGRFWDSLPSRGGTYGYYLSASLCVAQPICAWNFNFAADYFSLNADPRCWGLSVRAVRAKYDQPKNKTR